MWRSKYMHRYIAVAVLLWVVEAQAVEIQRTYQVHADRNSASQIYYVAGGVSDFVSVPLDTKIEVEDGDRITVMAEGSWGNSSDLTFGPGGNPHENIASGYPGAGMPVAALIGRFGDGRWFYVGTGMTGTVSGSGLFTLAFNDTDYGNNWGTVTVTVTVNLESKVYRVECDQDTDVISCTKWANANKTNEGINYLIEPIIANDGYGTKHVVYLGFELTSNSDFVQGLADGEEVIGYELWAYSDHNFAQGDAVIGDVRTDIYYVSNDEWWEGPYWSWSVINSTNPFDGMTWDNQVGYDNFLDTEDQDDYQGWYSWNLSSSSFTVSGTKDDPNYLTLAMVPNGISKTSAWYLVPSFASTEYHNSVPVDSRGNLVPYLEVTTIETCKKYKDELSLCEEEKSQLEDNVGRLTAELSSCTDEVNRLTSELDTCVGDVDRLTSELDGCRDTLTVLEADLEGLLAFVRTPPGVRKKVDFQPKSDIVKQIKEALLPEFGYGRNERK